MANYFNVFAGFLTFLASSVLGFIFWSPIGTLLGTFSTELFVIAGGSWVAVLFYGIVYAPFVMIVSDDRG